MGALAAAVAETVVGLELEDWIDEKEAEGDSLRWRNGQPWIFRAKALWLGARRTGQGRMVWAGLPLMLVVALLPVLPEARRAASVAGVPCVPSWSASA